jgi:hypothetical protein
MNSERDGSRREFLGDGFFNVATSRRRSTGTGLTASPFDSASVSIFERAEQKHTGRPLQFQIKSFTSKRIAIR